MCPQFPSSTYTMPSVVSIVSMRRRRVGEAAVPRAMASTIVGLWDLTRGTLRGSCPSVGWMTATEDLWVLNDYLLEIPHWPILTPAMEKVLCKVDRRLFGAGRFGMAM